jgi:hypothetical protein
MLHKIVLILWSIILAQQASFIITYQYSILRYWKKYYKEMDGKVNGLLIHIKHILEFNLCNLTHKITEMLIFQYRTIADFSHKA